MMTATRDLLIAIALTAAAAGSALAGASPPEAWTPAGPARATPAVDTGPARSPALRVDDALRALQALHRSGLKARAPGPAADLPAQQLSRAALAR